MFDLRFHLICANSICLLFGAARSCSLEIVKNNSCKNLCCEYKISPNVIFYRAEANEENGTFFGGM